MKNYNVLKTFLIILMILSCITFIGCYSTKKGSDTDYIIQKGKQASVNIDRIKSFMPDDYISPEVNEIESTRQKCNFGMIACIVVFVSSLILFFSASQNEAKEATPRPLNTNKYPDFNKPPTYTKTPNISNDTKPVISATSGCDKNLERLRTLNQMKTDGLITEDEYNLKKKEILDNI